MLKKFKTLIIALILVLTITGCGAKNIEGNLEDIMTKVYSDIKEDERPMGLANTLVTDENVEYYLGTSDIEFESALASESMIGSIAHSTVLIRTKENADIEAIKTKIKENVDPRKWICVGVEKEDVIIKNKGDLIILIIVEDQTTREKLDQGFDNL
ncbi:MAG: hypothetical protein IJ501_03700 [Bacilli bacterium]|nr:hypothetical protein [Bacilli bacterium]